MQTVGMTVLRTLNRFRLALQNNNIITNSHDNITVLLLHQCHCIMQHLLCGLFHYNPRSIILLATASHCHKHIRVNGQFKGEPRLECPSVLGFLVPTVPEETFFMDCMLFLSATGSIKTLKETQSTDPNQKTSTTDFTFLIHHQFWRRSLANFMPALDCQYTNAINISFILNVY